MILVLDNYDSFTWNLVHLLQSFDVEVRVVRNDATSAESALASGASGFVLSPGPGRPETAGVSLALVAAAAAARRPLLGVCLGHQAIAMHFGGRIVRAPAPVHGKPSRIVHDGEGMFAGLPFPLTAIRYNSLIAAAETLPPWLEVVATGDDGTVQAVRHRDLPIHGVQFHPESVGSQGGRALLANFLALCVAPADPAGTSDQAHLTSTRNVS